jgi:hypothetical protein
MAKGSVRNAGHKRESDKPKAGDAKTKKKI